MFCTDHLGATASALRYICEIGKIESSIHCYQKPFRKITQTALLDIVQK